MDRLDEIMDTRSGVRTVVSEVGLEGGSPLHTPSGGCVLLPSFPRRAFSLLSLLHALSILVLSERHV